MELPAEAISLMPMVSEEFKAVNRVIYNELAKSSEWVAEWDEEGFITFLLDGGDEYIVGGCPDIDKTLSPGMTLSFHRHNIKACEDILDRVNQFNFDVDSVRACWYDCEGLYGVRFDVYFNLGFLDESQYVSAVSWGINQIKTVLDMFVGVDKLFPCD
ncbi:MAG: hypothetical protein K2H46_00310 [Muribaculaceae bacterium]|nr:hypothetical protein [Muribaculaceae bacterium]